MKRKIISDISQWSRQGVLSVLGPTGSGKTSLVLNFLKSLPSNEASQYLLVSVDSVAFYRGLDIGSAKVVGHERNHFYWCGLDFLNIDEAATTKLFLKEVEEPILKHLEARRPVILVGGSGFYERALVDGMAPGEKSDEVYQKELESFSNEILHAKLLSFDPKWAQKIYPNDRYRITRYLDLVDRQGLSWKDLNETRLRNANLQKLWNETSTLILGTQTAREDFRVPLKTRIEEMLLAGWEDEVRKLLKMFSPRTPGMQSMGYREMSGYVEGEYGLEDCKVLILKAHMAYVKRQKTWFNAIITKSNI